MGINEEFVTYNGEEAWIVFVIENDWWAEKLVGWIYNENESIVPAYFSDLGIITGVRAEENTDIVFGREPTKEDAIAISNGCCVSFIGGKLSEEQR